MASSSPANPYRRFPGSGAHLIHRVRLYVGPDHLLQVTATGYSESYRRFFFRDIQVISLHKTAMGMIWNLLLGGLLPLLAALALTTGEEAWPVWAVFAGLVALPLGFNLARGATCACFIQTAVQQQRLYSVNRVRRARRLLEQIKPLIATAQSAVTAQTLPSGDTAGPGEPPGESLPPILS